MDSIITLIKYYRHHIVAVMAVAVSLLLMLSVRPENRGAGMIQDTVLDVIGGAERMVQSPVAAYLELERQVAQWRNIYGENRRFQTELVQLRPLGVRLQELELENHRLRQLLFMPMNPRMRAMSAQVVGDASSAFAHSLILNVGRDQGVEVDASVMVPQGVVGRLVQVSNHTSLVLTLQDLNSRVPVLVQRSRVRAVAAGTNNPRLSLEYVPWDADVVVGDRVITSGIGGGFPKGLFLGEVHEVKKASSGLFQRIMVRTLVDFDRIEAVRLQQPARRTSPVGSPSPPHSVGLP